MHREVCCQRTVIRQGAPAGWLLYRVRGVRLNANHLMS